MRKLFLLGFLLAASLAHTAPFSNLGGQGVGGGGSTGAAGGIAASDNTDFTGAITFSNSADVTGVLKLDSSAGTAGFVLTSSGASTTPEYVLVPGVGKKIYDLTLVNAGSFTVTGISGAYNRLHVVADLRVTGTGNDVLLGINGAFTNLTTTVLAARNNGVADTAFTNTTIGYCAYNTTIASSFTRMEFDIIYYSDTTRTKVLFGKDGAAYDGVATLHVMTGYWDSTSAITQIDLKPGSSDTFIVGSQLRIYGMND